MNSMERIWFRLSLRRPVGPRRPSRARAFVDEAALRVIRAPVRLLARAMR